MKRFFTIIGFFIFSFTAVYAQNNIGIFVGGGVSNMRMISDDASFNEVIYKDMTFMPAYYGGVNFENILLERQLYLQFGLQANSRGFSANNDSVTYFIHNIYIPLEIKYKYFFSRRGESYAFASAGPYVSASYKGTKSDIAAEEAAAVDTTGLITFSKEMKFGKLASDDLEPIDFGIHASVGYGYSYIQIAYNFSMGLRNMFPSLLFADEENGADIPKLKNMSHSITVGFYFTNK